MANIFDQFEAPPKPAATANVFDQFESPSAAAPAVAEPVASGLPQFASAADAERKQDAFVQNEGTTGTVAKHMLSRAFNPSDPIAPASGLNADWLTRVAPRSVTSFIPKVVGGVYDAIKGQTDPLIEGLADTTNPNAAAEMRQKMETNALNAVKGLGAATTSGLGFGMGEDGNVNWSMDNAKRAWLSDPAMAAAGVIPMAHPAMDLAKPAIKGTVKAVADTGAGILGTTTGTGTNFIKQAVKAGYEGSADFVKHMRGEGEGGAEIVQSAKDALGQIATARGDEYRVKLKDIADNNNTADLNLAPIRSAWEVAKTKFGIKTEDVLDSNGVPTGETRLNLDRSTLGRKEMPDVQEVSDMLEGWGTKAGDTTPLGLDLLKRKLDNLYTESKDSRVIVSGLRDIVKKTIVEAVPEYADMTKGYETATGMINEMDRTLSLGRKPMIDTTMRKLTQAMRDNFQFRHELVTTLSDMTGEDLPSMIAGYNMSSWQPQGGFGRLTSLGAIGGAAAHVLTPAYLAGLVAASPRLVGESMRAIGITGRAARVVIDAIPEIRAKLAAQKSAKSATGEPLAEGDAAPAVDPASAPDFTMEGKPYDKVDAEVVDPSKPLGITHNPPVIDAEVVPPATPNFVMDGPQYTPVTPDVMPRTDPLAIGHSPEPIDAQLGSVYADRGAAPSAADLVGDSRAGRQATMPGNDGIAPEGQPAAPMYSVSDGSKTVAPAGDRTAAVQAEFPKSEIIDHGDGNHTVNNPNGTTVHVNSVGDITMTPEQKLSAGDALGRELGPTDVPVASFQMISREGVVSLTQEGAGELPHEVFHAAMEMALTAEEKSALIAKHGTEESAASAYKEYRDNRDARSDTILGKVYNYVQDLVAGLSKSNAAFRDIENGAVWTRVAEKVDAKQGALAPDYSIRTWSEQEKAAVKAVAAKEGISEKKVGKWIKDIDNAMARVVADSTLDFNSEASDLYSALKSNSDKHYTVSLDFSTLCRKRYELMATIEAIQTKTGRALTKDTWVDVRAELDRMGYDVSCGACYVDAKRMEAGKFINEFIDSHPTEDSSQFITQSGIDGLKRDKPELYAEFKKKLGSNNAKTPESRVDYKHEIRDYFTSSSAGKTRVVDMNKRSGLRWQSWSDFEVPHMLDAMQATLDMSLAGLKGHGYTKVPDFVLAMGNTGLMINMSLIAKGTGFDALGKLIFDPKEGMDFDRAMELRDAHEKTTGTIAIGISDRHVLALLADPRIDYVIPYHASGLSGAIAKKFNMDGWRDYTDTQTEGIADMAKFHDVVVSKMKDTPAKKRLIEKFEAGDEGGYSKEAKKAGLVGVPFVDFWSDSRSGKANANAYLRICREKGLDPKFRGKEYANGNALTDLTQEAGYWKLLIDRKSYDHAGKNITQKAVTPVYDNAAIQGIYDRASDNPVPNKAVSEVVDRVSAKLMKGDTLRPSVQYQGKQINGKVGQTHDSLLADNKIGLRQKHLRGSVGNDGGFVPQEVTAPGQVANP